MPYAHRDPLHSERGTANPSLEIWSDIELHNVPIGQVVMGQARENNHLTANVQLTL